MFKLDIILAFCMLCINAVLVLYVIKIIKRLENFRDQNNRAHDVIVHDVSNDSLLVPKEEWKKMCRGLEKNNNMIEENNNMIKDLQNQVSILMQNNDSPITTKPAQENISKNSNNTHHNGTVVESSKQEKLIARPQNNSEYKYLKVGKGGKLTLVSTKDDSYYRAWETNGILYYEFSSPEKMGKAINNRTSIIEPFCDISGDSIDPDKAACIETETTGELNDDFSINKKTLIIYK